MQNYDTYAAIRDGLFAEPAQVDGVIAAIWPVVMEGRRERMSRR